jgi:hypothetical protein
MLLEHLQLSSTPLVQPPAAGMLAPHQRGLEKCTSLEVHGAWGRGLETCMHSTVEFDA